MDSIKSRNLIGFADILMYTNNSDLISRYELDKFILSRLNSLTASELVEAFTVFANSDYTEVLDAIEIHTISNINFMEIKASTELLYFLG